MRRILSALIGGWPVITRQVQRICAPGKWRVWRDDAGLRVEILEATKGRTHGA